ncbi:unnamed protein product [Auanema sp. JU1783]|nr:unnamed protein product [Auanema sp. JU1783]
MSSNEIEKEYVHDAYKHLASYQQNSISDNRNAALRLWPNIKKFMDQLAPGSVVIDVGCGEAKYSSPTSTVFGVDTCKDVLTSTKQRADVQLILGDAFFLPFRDEAVDSVLLVSVLHHVSTVQRRRTVLTDAIRCLRPGGQMIVCVWAYEQPNAQFPSQDVLVPWKSNEQVMNGRLPAVRFHMDSTKEQRIIEASIPVTIQKESLCSSSWINSLIDKFQSINTHVPFFSRPPTAPPQAPATPRNRRASLLSGLSKWSPMLSRRLTSFLVPVQEQLADEMTKTIMQEALAEAIEATKDVTLYRYYHVFRKGELEELFESIPGVRIVQCNYEHANWCVVIEKVQQDSIRP